MMSAIACRAASLCALALTLSAHANADSPLRIHGSLRGWDCEIPLAVAGHTYHFVIDSGSWDTCLSPSAYKQIMSKNPSAEIKIGTQEVSVKGIDHDDLALYREEDNVDGIVGIDVLSKLTVGIDYKTGDFLIWPNGITFGETADWLSAANPDSAPVYSALEPNQDISEFFVETDFGKVLLDTGSPDFVLPKRAGTPKGATVSKFSYPLVTLGGKDGTSTFVVLPQCTVANVPLSYRVVEANDTDEDGILGPEVFGSTRIVLDFAHRWMAVAPPRAEDDLRAELDVILRNSSRIANGHVFFLGTAGLNGKPEVPAELELVSINGIETSKLAALTIKHDPQLAALLVGAVNMLKIGYKFELSYKGKRFPVHLPPPHIPRP